MELYSIKKCFFLLLFGCGVLLFGLVGCDDTQKSERIQVINKAEELFEKDSATAAIKHLQTLSTEEGNHPEILKAKDLIVKYQKAEKKRSTLEKECEKLQKEEKWDMALKRLEELLKFHTPKGRKKEIEAIQLQLDKITNLNTEAKNELKKWSENLRTWKQEIRDYYRREEFIKAEEPIVKILNLSLPKGLDATVVKKSEEELKEGKELAQETQDNITKRRFEIFKEDVLIEKTKNIHSSLDSLGQQLGSREVAKKALLSLKSPNFSEEFCKAIEKNNVAAAKDPVAELYRQEKLLAVMKEFAESFDRQDYFKDLPTDFKNKIYDLWDKVEKDHKALNEKYAKELELMKTRMKKLGLK